MGFFDRLFRNSPEHDPRFVGRWQLKEADADLELQTGVTMTFKPDGQLLYAIPTETSQQIMRLTWRIEGDSLITDQPSSPRLERTKFTFLSADSVVLDYDGSRAWFDRTDR